MKRINWTRLASGLFVVFGAIISYPEGIGPDVSAIGCYVFAIWLLVLDAYDRHFDT